MSEQLIHAHILRPRRSRPARRRILRPQLPIGVIHIQRISLVRKRRQNPVPIPVIPGMIEPEPFVARQASRGPGPLDLRLRMGSITLTGFGTGCFRTASGRLGKTHRSEVRERGRTPWGRPVIGMGFEPAVVCGRPSGPPG